MIYGVIELVMVAMFVIFMVTQFFVPIVRGTPVLPMFVRRRFDRGLTDARGAVDEAKSAAEIQVLRDQARRILDNAAKTRQSSGGRPGTYRSKFDK